MTEPAAPKAVQHHVRQALREVELDHSGERIREIETHLRTAAALLNQGTIR
jgi:hypothetical protein